MEDRHGNRFRLVIFALLFVAFSGVAHAANNCPWLNDATASGFLGGSAVGTFVPATQSMPASCTFVQNEGGVRNLTITVEEVSNPHGRLVAVAQRCGTQRQPVAAIGNEAFRCMVKDRKRTQSERIVGRVRDQVFAITLGTTVKQDATLTPAELEMRIYSAAEEVSGNLF